MSSKQSHWFLIADDHPLFRGALTSAIDSFSPDSKIDVAASLDETISFLGKDNDVDLVLLDLNMPGSQGLSGLMQIRALFPAVPVTIVSAVEDPQIIRNSIAMGASGYIPKSSDLFQIRQAIEMSLAGENYLPANFDLNFQADSETADILARLQTLTPQQNKVLGMLASGLLNKQIAYELDVSEATIKAHVSAILSKLHVDSRTQAVIQLGKVSGSSNAI